MSSPLPPGLYGMADVAFGDPVQIGLALAAGGCRVVQLRGKAGDSARRQAYARAMVSALRPLGVRVIINDDLKAAALADGVHLGQGDGDLVAARQTLGPAALIGRSTHDLDQVRTAVAAGADYLGFGPIFGTTTKADTESVVGLEGLQRAVELSARPVVAIGGLTLASLPALKQTGVHGWAVISAILARRAQDPRAVTEQARAWV